MQVIIVWTCTICIACGEKRNKCLDKENFQQQAKEHFVRSKSDCPPQATFQSVSLKSVF